MTPLIEFLLEHAPYVAVDVATPLIDGALGIACGVTASSLLPGLGIPPAASGATLHAAECWGDRRQQPAGS